ncbi:unnamed protein product, partial [Rotaria magnacalcarata]
MPCFSHTLQFTVGDGLKECGNAKPALAKVATIAKLSVFALFAEATTRTQIENSASISLVAPSVLSIYYDLEHEQVNCKHLGSLCRTLIISLHERFGGLLKR